MKTPKIIFFDIDETLYRKSSNYLPESVPAAIRALKARGIKRVCEALGVPLDETMAFGDGLNDVEMFKTVGYGVAMGDAVPELQALAQYQTGTVEEDGIYNALQHLGIIA